VVRFARLETADDHEGRADPEGGMACSIGNCPFHQKRDLMEIDQTTLADLEVLEARDGTKGILGLVDRTRTRQGHQALRRRIERPLTSMREIRKVQAALSFLSQANPLLLLNDEMLVGAERYARSNIVIRKRGRLGASLEEVWLRIRYREVLRELIEGQAALRVLIHFVRRVIPALAGEGAPALLTAYGERLGALADEIIPALEVSPVLHSDSLVRTDLRDEVLEVTEILAELDALQSMALASATPGWTTPELVESSEFMLEAKGAFHPFVDGGMPNPIRLNGGEPLVFLTGPNMAGKTTYLKTVGLIVLLAQTGMNVPASSLRFAPVEVVFASLNPADNLRAGISYFYAEILRVKEAAEILAGGRKALVLFDEVFKGTNVKDALEASAQVIDGFAKTRRSGSIFASHLSELYETLRTNPAVRFCQFDGEIIDGSPVFAYKLGPGVSEKRFGLLLLQEARVPDLIAKISA